MKFVKRLAPSILICLFIPISLNFIMYYGVVNTSPARIYTIEQLEDHFSGDVLKHRVLGRFLLMATNEVVTGIQIPFHIKTFDRISAFFGVESLSLYHSLFVLNTIFFCLTIFIIYLIFNKRWVNPNATEKHFYLLLLTSLIALSQFTVVPYDTLSYFFISLVIMLMLKKSNIAILVATGLLIIIGTMARETIALTLSFYLLLVVKKKDFNFSVNYKNLIFFVCCFIVSYLSIRFFTGLDGDFTGSIKFPQNTFALQNFIGFLFMVSITMIFIWDKYAGKHVALFLLYSSPYILVLILTGILFEIRLWMPVIIIMMVIFVLSRSDSIYYKASMKLKEEH